MEEKHDESVSATVTKSIDIGANVTVKELTGHLEITAEYVKDTKALALEADRRSPEA